VVPMFYTFISRKELKVDPDAQDVRALPAPAE
jgi:hypothetical protein